MGWKGVAVISPTLRKPKKASEAAAWNIRLSWCCDDLLACEDLSNRDRIVGVIGHLYEPNPWEHRIPLNSILSIVLPFTGFRKPSTCCRNDTADRYTQMVGRETVDHRWVAKAAMCRLDAGAG